LKKKRNYSYKTITTKKWPLRRT